MKDAIDKANLEALQDLSDEHQIEISELLDFTDFVLTKAKLGEGIGIRLEFNDVNESWAFSWAELPDNTWINPK